MQASFPARLSPSLLPYPRLLNTIIKLTAMHSHAALLANSINSSINDPFQTTKLHILRQKYEYMTHYLSETEARVQELKANNSSLRHRAETLEALSSTTNLPDEDSSRAHREEQRIRTKKIEELKRLIGEYRYLCQEAGRTAEGGRGRGERENSFLGQLEGSENENLHNTSVRNRSYQKVKTSVYCQKCESDFRPNEYYSHLRECEEVRTRQGYRTVRH
jgi:hypothetical protein